MPNAHQCADHLRCALAALIAEASKGKIGLHGVHTRRFLIAQEQIDAFLQLRTDSFSVIFVILVGRKDCINIPTISTPKLSVPYLWVRIVSNRVSLVHMAFWGIV